MQKRTKNSYRKSIYDFIKSEIFVVCPKCSKQAFIKSKHFSFCNQSEVEIKLVCTKCGYNKQLSEKPSVILYSSSKEVIQGRHYIVGGAIDPFFHMQLWLTSNCGENLLWAYNYEHLNFLREHVDAKLRERNGQDLANKSLGSRLPK